MRKLGGILLLVLTAVVYAIPAQQEETPPADPQYEFVSGLVMELPPGKIVVNRALIGKPPENRTFVLGPDTKIEGRLRVKVRVTVGFRSGEDAEPTAVRVIVRSQAGKK